MTMVMPQLRVEAEAEVGRLTAARALTNDGDDVAVGRLEGDRPWMAVARGWRTRQALGARIVLLLRVGFEDATGVTIESRLIAVTIDLTQVGRASLSRRSIEALIPHLQPRIRGQVDDAIAPWQRAAEATVRSFAAAHSARTLAIVEPLANTRTREFQPGLFDRRAERGRARDALARESDRVEATAAEPAAASRSCGAITRRPPQLLLVLTPRSPCCPR
jgi:hypothetical protein